MGIFKVKKKYEFIWNRNRKSPTVKFEEPKNLSSLVHTKSLWFRISFRLHERRNTQSILNKMPVYYIILPSNRSMCKLIFVNRFFLFFNLVFSLFHLTYLLLPYNGDLSIISIKNSLLLNVFLSPLNGKKWKGVHTQTHTVKINNDEDDDDDDDEEFQEVKRTKDHLVDGS